MDCLSLGVLDSYRQGLWDNFATIRCVDGLTLEGNWSGGFAALTTIIVSAGVSFTGTLLKKGAALVVGGSIRSDMNALQIDATGTVCDFAPANITNDAGFLMSGVRVNPASIAFPNMPESSVKAIFTNCTGTDDTHIGGQWSITTAIATTISTINTPVKLAGTTTYVDLQHMTGAASNAMTYIATDKIAVAVSGVLPLAGTSNDVINAKLRLWDNSASGYVEISQSGGVTMNAGGRAEGVSIEGITDMDTNDRVEIWVENQTGGRNVTADLGGLVHISKRT